MALGEDLQGILTELANQQAAKAGIPTIEQRQATQRSIEEEALKRQQVQATIAKLLSETEVAKEGAATNKAYREALGEQARARAQALLAPKPVTAPTPLQEAQTDLAKARAEGIRHPQPKAGGATPTVTVKTTNAQGNPVTKIVPKVAGAEYAAPRSAQMEQSVGVAKSADEAISRMEELAKSPEMATGILGGNLSKLEQRVQGPHGPGGEFDFLSNQLVDLVYLKSGKQINDREMNILRQMIPNRGRGNLPEQIRLFKNYADTLLEKYKSPAGAAAPGPGGAAHAGEAPAPKRLKFNPATGKLE